MSTTKLRKTGNVDISPSLPHDQCGGHFFGLRCNINSVKSKLIVNNIRANLSHYFPFRFLVRLFQWWLYQCVVSTTSECTVLKHTLATNAFSLSSFSLAHFHFIFYAIISSKIPFMIEIEYIICMHTVEVGSWCSLRSSTSTDTHTPSRSPHQSWLFILFYNVSAYTHPYNENLFEILHFVFLEHVASPHRTSSTHLHYQRRLDCQSEKCKKEKKKKKNE